MYFYSILRCIYSLNVVELSLWQILNVVCFYILLMVSDGLEQRLSPKCFIYIINSPIGRYVKIVNQNMISKDIKYFVIKILFWLLGW